MSLLCKCALILSLFLWVYITIYSLAVEVEEATWSGCSSSHTWSSFWTWLELPLSCFSYGFPLFSCICEIYSAPTHWQCHNPVKTMTEIKDLFLCVSFFLSFLLPSPSVRLTDNEHIISWVDLEMEMALFKLCKKGFGYVPYRW